MLAKLVKQLFSRSAPPVRAQSIYALVDAGDYERAERECDAVSDMPSAELDFLRGIIAQKAGRLERAAAAMTSAVARDDAPRFRFGLASVLSDLGNYAEALANFETYFGAADQSDGARFGACIAAGQCATRLEDVDRAAQWFERAFAIDPDNALARERLVIARYQQSRTDEARELLTREAQIDSAACLRRAMLLPGLYGSTEEIDEARAQFSTELDELLERPAEPVQNPVAQIGIPPFYLAYHNRPNAELLKKVCRVMRRAYPSAAAAKTVVRTPSSHIRIGFVSTFFHSHSVGRTTLGLIRDLPRERFSVHVFAVSPEQDAMRAVIEAAADDYTALPSDLEKVRQAIEAAKLDVLVFADIGMHPLTYFLALCRVAPLQIATWGHSETSGIDTVDYYLSAKGLETANAQEHYSEGLIAPDAFFLPGYPRPTLDEPLGREALGLPTNKHLYTCLQFPFKFHPDVDRVFGELLDRDPLAEIVLLEWRRSWAAQLRKRFGRTLGRNASRVRFLENLGHQRYLATLAAADVALDPLYFGGCNSSCEAMALGVPLVTLPGEHLHGRFTLALYREMDIDDCIAVSVEDYVEKACRIASDPDFRHALGATIRNRSDVLFERRDITRAFGGWLADRVT